MYSQFFIYLPLYSIIIGKNIISQISSNTSKKVAFLFNILSKIKMSHETIDHYKFFTYIMLK